MLRKTIKFVPLTLLLAAGCSVILPDGEPPAGDIISPEVKVRDTATEVRTRAVTEILAKALSGGKSGQFRVAVSPKVKKNTLRYQMLIEAIIEARQTAKNVVWCDKTGDADLIIGEHLSGKTD